MAYLKFALVASSLLVSTFSQDAPLPTFAQITEGAAPDGTCGGCYVVADVAAVVFGTESVTQLNTELVITQTGFNGSYVTTSTIFGQAQLSIGTDSAIGGSVYSLANNPTVTVNGQTLVSPTAYQIFTAYSVTSSFIDSDGKCQTYRGSRNVPPNPYKASIPSGNDPDYIVNAEKEFIASIGLTCSPGGQSAETTTLASGTELTTTSSTMVPLRFTPQPLNGPSVTEASSTGGGNYSYPSFTNSIITGAGPSFSTSFHKSTLPLMGVGALSILIAAAML